MKEYQTLIFDLDGTLAISKSAIDQHMAQILSELSQSKRLVVITGGLFEQIKKQVIDQLLETTNFQNIVLMPTSGSRMYSYNNNNWDMDYAFDMTESQRTQVIESLQNAVEQSSFTIAPEELAGSQIEDRTSQVTFSALGQQQLPEIKETWDPDHTKREEMMKYLSHLNEEFDVKIGGTTSIDICLLYTSPSPRDA